MAGLPPACPPSVGVAVKALACELPHRYGLPLSRWSLADIQREVVAEGIVAQVSGSTLWRWLSRETLSPWRYRSWIFPRDPNFAVKAGRVLDLYHGCWEGAPAGPPRLCAVGRRENQHPGPRPHPSFSPARIGPLRTHRTRIPTLRCVRVPGRLGRSSRQTLRPLRGNHRHQALRPPRRAGHGGRTISLRAARLFGLPTTVPPTAAKKPPTGCAPRGPRSCSSTPLSMPGGSIKSRSTSPSSNARSSLPVTFPPSPNYNSVCSPSKATTNKPQDLHPRRPAQTPRPPQLSSAASRRLIPLEYVTVIVKMQDLATLSLAPGMGLHEPEPRTSESGQRPATKVVNTQFRRSLTRTKLPKYWRAGSGAEQRRGRWGR